MRTIASLFGKSPFIALQNHMDIVARCISKVPDVFNAYYDGDLDAVRALAKRISKEEYEADQVKDEIRNNLRRSLFMPVNRSHFLSILSLQDEIADKAENIGVLLGFKIIDTPAVFREHFDAFLKKNMESFTAVHEVIGQLDELLETSFGGAEANKVLGMVQQVAQMEYEADLIQRDVLKALLDHDGDFSHGEFWLWTRVVRQVSYIADLSENLANAVRVTLELK